MDLHATLAVSFIGRGQARIMEVGPVHPDHGDCCICHELGRCLTRKLGQSQPSTLSFRTQCCLGRVLINRDRPPWASGKMSRARARSVQDCRPFYLPGGLYALRALTACFRTWKISSWVNRRVSFTFWRTSAATTTPEIAAAAPGSGTSKITNAPGPSTGVP